MPTDSNGVFSLPNGYLANTGDVIQASQHNPPLEDLASSMTQRMMRSGATPMSGPLKLADGTEPAPSLTFNSASGTGLYKTADGVAVSISGTKVAEFTPAGLTKGNRYIGELIPWTGTSAPARCVLPYGQTLDRTAYADLWAFAQTEIAAGNLFYNNGNGSTTFGIGDLRGRSISCPDNIGGGTDPNRLTAGALANVRNSIGGTGGESGHTLTINEIPSHAHANTLADPGHTHGFLQLNGGLRNDGTSALTVNTVFQNTQTNPAFTNITISNASTGGSGGHNNMQPAILCNYALYAGA